METPCERPKTLEKCRFNFMERGKLFFLFLDIVFICPFIVLYRYGFHQIRKNEVRFRDLVCMLID